MSVERRRHVLVVDDNATNLSLVSDTLEYAGFEVARAMCARHAMSLLELELPDLILIDIALPGVDGLTFTRQLKAHPLYHRIPVVALTAYAMKGDDQKAYAAGCQGYITKPIDTRRLVAEIAPHLGDGGSSP